MGVADVVARLDRFPYKSNNNYVKRSVLGGISSVLLYGGAALMLVMIVFYAVHSPDNISEAYSDLLSTKELELPTVGFQVVADRQIVPFDVLASYANVELWQIVDNRSGEWNGTTGPSQRLTKTRVSSSPCQDSDFAGFDCIGKSKLSGHLDNTTVPYQYVMLMVRACNRTTTDCAPQSQIDWLFAHSRVNVRMRQERGTVVRSASVNAQSLYGIPPVYNLVFQQLQHLDFSRYEPIVQASTTYHLDFAHIEGPWYSEFVLCDPAVHDCDHDTERLPNDTTVAIALTLSHLQLEQSSQNVPVILTISMVTSTLFVINVVGVCIRAANKRLGRRVKSGLSRTQVVQLSRPLAGGGSGAGT